MKIRNKRMDESDEILNDKLIQEFHIWKEPPSKIIKESSCKSEES